MDAVRQNLLPGHGEKPAFVPGHVPRRLRRPSGELGRHGPEVLQGHGLGVNPGLVLEPVCPVIHAPQQAESRPDGQQGAPRPQGRPIGPASPPVPGPGHGNDAPDEIAGAKEHCQHLHQLHDGEGDQVADPPQPPPEGPGEPLRYGVHQPPLPPEGEEGQQEPAVRQQPDMKVFMGLETSFHGHSAAASNCFV